MADVPISVSEGSLTLTGQAPGMGLGIAASQGSLTLAGQTPGMGLGIAASQGSLTLAGQTPDPDVAYCLLADELNLWLPLFTVEASIQEPAEIPFFTLESTGVTGEMIFSYPKESVIPILTIAATGHVENLGNAAVSLPMLALAADGGASSDLSFPLFSVAVTMLGGNVGDGEVDFPLFTAAGTGTPYPNYGEFTLPMFSVAMTLGVGNTASAGFSLPLFTLSSTGVTGQTGSAAITLPLFTATGHDDYAESGDIALTLPLFTVDSTIAVMLAATRYCSVMNSRTFALTEYSNYDFNSFAMFNGRYLAASEDGLFLIGGSTDDTVDISSELKGGSYDFGVGNYKRVHTAYVRIQSDGDMMLTAITEDEETRKYIIPHYGANGVVSNRVGLAKGVRSVRWQFGMTNVAGADFSVDTMDLHATISQRRI